MTEPVAEWHPREHFAEIAEALSISTEYIFAAHPLVPRPGWAVLYTPGWEEGDQTMHIAVLVRDKDEILRLVAESRPIEGAAEKLREMIEEAAEQAQEELDE